MDKMRQAFAPRSASRRRSPPLALVLVTLQFSAGAATPEPDEPFTTVQRDTIHNDGCVEICDWYGTSSGDTVRHGIYRMKAKGTIDSTSGRYQHGLKHGLWLTASDTSLGSWTKETWREGALDGPFLRGALGNAGLCLDSGKYCGGRRMGRWKETADIHGRRVTARGIYDANGLKTGIWRVRTLVSMNGDAMVWTGPFVEGVPHGVWEGYFTKPAVTDTGVNCLRMNYQRGKPSEPAACTDTRESSHAAEHTYLHDHPELVTGLAIPQDNWLPIVTGGPSLPNQPSTGSCGSARATAQFECHRSGWVASGCLQEGSRHGVWRIESVSGGADAQVQLWYYEHGMVTAQSTVGHAK